jgi:Tfp pilus assembly protein PilO
MDKTKQTLVAALMAMLVVVAGGWFFLISPQRSNVSSLNAQTQQVAASNVSLQGQIAQLKAESAQVSDAQATLAAIARRLPPDPQEANLIDNLKKAADAANVDLQVITPGPPVLMAAPAAAVVTAAPATTSAGTSAAATKPATSRTAPAGNQLYQIPLSLTVAGNYFDVEMFVHSLEGMQRAMVINQLSLAATTASTTVQGGSSTSPAAATTGQGVGGTGTSAGSSTSTSTGTGKTATIGTTSKSGKATKTTTAKPGTVAGAKAELDGQTPFVPDSNTLAVTIVGNVFAMYSPAAAAAVAAAGAVAPAAVTPTPATTK